MGYWDQVVHSHTHMYICELLKNKRYIGFPVKKEQRQDCSHVDLNYHSNHIHQYRGFVVAQALHSEILKPAQLVYMIISGKGCLTGCGLHGYSLVSVLFKQVNPI